MAEDNLDFLLGKRPPTRNKERERAAELARAALERRGGTAEDRGQARRGREQEADREGEDHDDRERRAREATEVAR